MVSSGFIGSLIFISRHMHNSDTRLTFQFPLASALSIQAFHLYTLVYESITPSHSFSCSEPCLVMLYWG